MRERLEEMGVLGEEGIGHELEGRRGLELMQEVEVEVAKRILGRLDGVRVGKGAMGHLEEHKRWKALERWVEGKAGEDSVFHRLRGQMDDQGRWKGCRLGRSRAIRKLY